MSTKLVNHVSNEDFLHGVTVQYKGLIIDIQKNTIPTHVFVPSDNQDSDTWEDTVLFDWDVSDSMTDYYEGGLLYTLTDYKTAVKDIIDNIFNSRKQKNSKKIQARLQKAADNGIDMWNKHSVVEMMLAREFPIVS